MDEEDVIAILFAAAVLLFMLVALTACIPLPDIQGGSDRTQAPDYSPVFNVNVNPTVITTGTGETNATVPVPVSETPINVTSDQPAGPTSKGDEQLLLGPTFGGWTTYEHNLEMCRQHPQSWGCAEFLAEEDDGLNPTGVLPSVPQQLTGE